VFVIPYSPLSRLLPTRTLLSKHWDIITEAIQPRLPKPMIAYQSATSLVKQLVYQKAAQEEKSRAKQAAAGLSVTQMSQRSIISFFTPI